MHALEHLSTYKTLKIVVLKFNTSISLNTYLILSRKVEFQIDYLNSNSECHDGPFFKVFLSTT